MSTPPVDVTAIVQQNSQQDVVQRKIAMDSLRSRLGDTRSKDERLRETCEGFESIFIQKMWEQMRKSVPKEGYLHSKDEETYQSMFDVELAKKMAASGGIGLAEMMYQQLSQQVSETARTTHSQLAPVAPKAPEAALAQAAATASEQDNAKTNTVNSMTLAAEDLYAPLNQEETEPVDNLNAAPAAHVAAVEQEHSNNSVSGIIASAIAALKQEVGNRLFGNEEAAPAAAPSMVQSATQADPLQAAQGKTTAQTASFQETEGQSTTAAPAPAMTAEQVYTMLEQQATATQTTAPAQEPLLEKTQAKEAQTDSRPTPRGMLPEGAVWPHSGQIFSHFGWQNAPDGGKRQWNAGIGIAAKNGDNILPCMPGKVAYVGPREGFGNTVVLEHEGGFVSFYGNVTPNNLALGDTVKAGTGFASVSTDSLSSPTGEKITPLFFELKRGEMALNPEAALNATMTASLGSPRR